MHINIRTMKLSLLVSFLPVLIASCGSGEEEKVVVDPSEIQYKTDTPAAAQQLPENRPPIINIVDTVSLKYVVLLMKDSVSSSERLGYKMDSIYNKVLRKVISDNNLQVTGPRIAWYRSSSAPFFFEAGIPVNKKPSKKLPKNISIRNIGGDSSVIAHFYGPYPLSFQAYEAVREWMASGKKKSKGMPYEIYVDEPVDTNGVLKDPYRVRTDIVFPHK